VLKTDPGKTEEKKQSMTEEIRKTEKERLKQVIYQYDTTRRRRAEKNDEKDEPVYQG
jgi:hypothetical protein